MTAPKLLGSMTADEFNTRYPVGTVIRYYVTKQCVKENRFKEGVTTGPAYTFDGRLIGWNDVFPCVPTSISRPGALGLSHLEVVEP